MVIGRVTADTETVTKNTGTEINLTGPGAVVFGIGFISMVAGIPIWITGSTKKKNARNTYLREYGYSYQPTVRPSHYLQLNIVRNGLELAFVF